MSNAPPGAAIPPSNSHYSTPSDPLLATIVAALKRGDCPDEKWPDAKGGYWALCPFHDDKHTGSFKVSTRGYICFSCGEKGGLRKLAQHLGLPADYCTSARDSEGGDTQFSLAIYADAKRLPEAFLGELGLCERRIQGRTTLVIPYYDAGHEEVAVRYRLGMSGDRRFRWRPGSKVHLYGLWRLDLAREQGRVVLVEGESDAQTLWYHDLPALGMPGASTWKAEWAKQLDGLTVYLWREPDQGGETFVAKVGESLPEVRVITAPEGCKDVSEAHVRDEDVPALMARLMDEAQPYVRLEEQRRQQQAQEALEAALSLAEADNILGEFDTLLDDLGLVAERRAAQLFYLALTSRLLPKPVSVVVKGPSSGGKSFCVVIVLKVFPPSAYLDFTSMSERALIYDDRPVAHRFIVLYEAQAMASSDTLSYLVRSLLSEGRIRYTTIESTSDGFMPRHIDRPGPTGLITTTTSPALDGENETRMFSVTVTDTPDQTAGILASLAREAAGGGPAQPGLAPWLALQRWLELGGDREVVIPFAPEIARRSDAQAVRLRRDFGAVLNLVRAHALLHQRHRQRDAQGRIVATLDDYAAVYALVAELVSEGVEATVSPTVRETVEMASRLYEENVNQFGDPQPISIRILADELGLDRSSVSRRVKMAAEQGYLQNLEWQRGRPARIVPGDSLPEERPVLPAPEELSYDDAHDDDPKPGGNGVQPPSRGAAIVQCSSAPPPEDSSSPKKCVQPPSGGDALVHYSPESSPDYYVVDTAEALEAVLSDLQGVPRLAVDTETTGTDPLTAALVGISLSDAPGRAWYLPVGHERGQQLPLEAAREALAPVLENPDLTVIMHHAKYDLNVLARHGLRVDGRVFDTMIAAQLLAPEGKAGLKELAKVRLGVDMTPIDDLIGNERTMAQVSIGRAAPYACADADLTLRLADAFEPELRQRDQWDLFTDVEMPLVPVLAAMERRGMAADRERLERMSHDLGARLEELEHKVRELAGHQINLNSHKQLTALLFDELGLRVMARTRSGAPSTKGEVLEKLRDAHPIVGLILEQRGLSKLKSTYADALPELIHPETGRIHTSFNQCGARTGRMSASRPNLQNVPTRTELGQKVRAVFVAPEGHLLLACDYSQIEMRVLAHLSKDPELCAAFQRGEDVHATTAAAVFGVSLKEVSDEQRQLAKAVNFGLIYGMTAKGLARRRGLSEGEAETFMEAYFQRFAGVRAFRDELIRRARDQGGAETLLGRQRSLPEINNDDDWDARSKAERQALNTPIQGSAADLIKLAMVRVDGRLREEGLEARMVLQVHDELLLEVPEAELERIVDLVVTEMEQVHSLDVPLTVDAKVGKNWLEMEEVERPDRAE